MSHLLLHLSIPSSSSSSIFSPPKQHHRHALLSPPLHAVVASSSTSPTSAGAIIVGAGLAGLAAANHLASASIPFLLLEASDAVGGRVRTDSLDGFLLDRGFQIFLTAYPEARRLLDYPSLRLRPFYPGALVFHSGRLHRLADPFRRPLDAIASLINPVGSLPDKLLVGLARLSAASRPDSELLSPDTHETSISDRLRAAGFSPSIVERFLRPFLAGIFFDRDLATTSLLFDFVFKCLALGDNAIPADGIAAIPEQLASRLPPGSLRLQTKVSSIDLEGASVTLSGGDRISSDLGVIVAVEQPEAERLLPQVSFPEKKPGVVRSTVCLYFSAERAPLEDPILVLNGSGQGIVNNMFFATNVAPSYGPKGKTLISVSLIGTFSERSDEDLTDEVIRELSGWFGSEVGLWKHLRTYRIGFAQPDQTPPTNLTGKDPRVAERIYVCGDHWSSATFDGALVSGRKAVEALIRDRGL